MIYYWQVNMSWNHDAAHDPGDTYPLFAGVSALIAGLMAYGGTFLDKVGWTTFQFYME